MDTRSIAQLDAIDTALHQVNGLLLGGHMDEAEHAEAVGFYHAEIARIKATDDHQHLISMAGIMGVTPRVLVTRLTTWTPEQWAAEDDRIGAQA